MWLILGLWTKAVVAVLWLNIHSTLFLPHLFCKNLWHIVFPCWVLMWFIISVLEENLFPHLKQISWPAFSLVWLNLHGEVLQ